MSNAISTLDYNLFTDPAFTQVWGDGTAGTFTMMSNGNDILRVYGQIAAGQNVADGVYSDAVTVLIMW